MHGPIMLQESVHNSIAKLRHIVQCLIKVLFFFLHQTAHFKVALRPVKSSADQYSLISMSICHTCQLD